ncbi:MAG: transglycosylase SLT domain-containing protein [Formivibrio sp.]|nr:transglycosylase SLT domain-containing protein [Formivibrio sp.]
MQIKALVAMGPSTYFFRDGRPHGVEYVWLLDFEKFINQGRDKSKQIHIQFIPVEPGELIPALYDGRGDLAAGLIPVSDGLRQLVSLSEPYLVDHWCAIGSKAAEVPHDLDDLATRDIELPSNSYARRLLLDVNETRRLDGKAEIVADDAGSGSTAEILLREANKGSSKKLTLSSRFISNLWSKIFSKTTQGVCLGSPVPVSWAVRRENNTLLAELNRFITAKKSTLINHGIELTRTYLHPDAVGKLSRTIDPLDKLAFFAPIFQLAATANNLDWLLLAAIGQRESGLSATKSESGPTGVMQVDPVTARKMGIKNPHDTGQNITAAARYLGHLRELFSSPEISPEDRLYFMLAAYNGGEGRLQGLRSKAAAEGLDPNRWLGQVEVIAQRSVGRRMVDYVSAVSRYYMAYQSADRKQQSEITRSASAPASP